MCVITVFTYTKDSSVMNQPSQSMVVPTDKRDQNKNLEIGDSVVKFSVDLTEFSTEFCE